MKPLGEPLGFSHVWAVDTTESLCVKVDQSGGWNPGAVCVQFFHGEDRTCRFSAIDRNTGWWTVVLTRDEYYWNSISAAFKKSVRDNTVREIRNRIA